MTCYDLDAGKATINVTAEDIRVKVSGNDLSNGYLAEKIVSGTNITVTELNDGGVETLQISSGGASILYNAETSGVFDGAVLSVNGGDNTKFDVSLGTAQIVDPTVIPVAIPTAVTIPQTLAITITNLASSELTYVLATSGGSITQQIVPPSAEQLRTRIFLGKLNHANNTNLSSVVNNPTLAVGVSSGLEDLMRNGIGIINATPIFPSAGTLLNINVSSGILWNIGSNYTADKLNPHQNTFAAYDSSVRAFPYLLSDGSIDTPLTNNVRPSTYESATGVTSAVPSLKWTNQRIYATITGSIVMMYGQTTYNSKGLALEGLSGENHVLPALLSSGDNILIGLITLVENITDLNNTTDAVFQNASKFGEFAKGGVSVTATTLQGAYNNSIPTAEILTDVTNAALTIRNGTGLADTALIYEGKNEAGTTTFSVDGNGDIVGNLIANNFASTQWGTTASNVSLANGAIANGFTFFVPANKVASGTTSWDEYNLAFGIDLTISGTNGSIVINFGPVTGVEFSETLTFSGTLDATVEQWVIDNKALALSGGSARLLYNGGATMRFCSNETVCNSVATTLPTGDMGSTRINPFTGVNAAAIDHILVPYAGKPYEGQRLQHTFRVNFGIATAQPQTLALSLRRFEDDSIIGSEMKVQRDQDVEGNQFNFITYTSGATDPFVSGGFYFALRNDSGTSVDINGAVGIYLGTTYQRPTNF